MVEPKPDNNETNNQQESFGTTSIAQQRLQLNGLRKNSMSSTSCSLYPRRTTLKSFSKIHNHCLTCIRPKKCIRMPYAFNQATQLSMEEKYSMILDVNYYQFDDDYPKKFINGVSDGINKKTIKSQDDDEQEFCPVVKCTNDGCEMVMHYCKMREHFLICQFQMVHCINSHYGCPYMLLRREMSTHLHSQCPANVVHCSAEWNRWPLHTTEKSPQSQVFCSPHSLNIHNLDVALALRDQRMLKQLWSASRQMKRVMRGCLSTHPAVPIKPYIGIRTFREFRNVQTNSADGTQQQSSNCDNIDEEKYINYAARIVESAYRESLEEILRQTANYFRRIYYERTSDYRQQQLRKKSNSICCQMLPSTNNINQRNIGKNDDYNDDEVDNISLNSHSNQQASNNLLLPLSPGQSFPSSSSINLPILTEADKLFFAEMCGENKNRIPNQNSEMMSTTMTSSPPPVPPPVPKCNTLSLEIAIRSYAFHHPKPRAMYTFRCGMDFRKDELEAHSRDIHSDIHGGLDGWIEHRCPLFQYGCTFVHRRLSPLLSKMKTSDTTNPTQLSTIVYNESLETFACCSLSNDLIDQQKENDSFFLNRQKSQQNHLSNSVSLDEADEESSNTDDDCLEMANDYQRQRKCKNNSGSSNHQSSFPLSTSSSSYSLLSNNSSAPLLLMSSSPSTSSDLVAPSISGLINNNNQQSNNQTSLSSSRKLSSSHLMMLMNNNNYPYFITITSLSQMPFEILQNICKYLDGLSLNNLSFTSKQMRNVVQTFVKRKGYVVLQWKRFELEKGKYQWRVVYKKWLFSTAMQPIQGWQLDADNVMARHLQICQFYDRVVHKNPFRLCPFDSDKHLQKIAPWTTKMIQKNNGIDDKSSTNPN